MRAEIAKKVYSKYPESKKEKECAREKRRMDEIRELFRKRLVEEKKEKREYT